MIPVPVAALGRVSEIPLANDPAGRLVVVVLVFGAFPIGDRVIGDFVVGIRFFVRRLPLLGTPGVRRGVLLGTNRDTLPEDDFCWTPRFEL